MCRALVSGFSDVLINCTMYEGSRAIRAGIDSLGTVTKLYQINKTI